ncbi:unnamed protein product [Spodoptera littoralis]|uniref:FP protein C-terminal domain-containing protein n=1 Tax=Spodoptera littoralis TaxID=7109 RepID=A0A9P0I2S8_SPOLI|nr:unnamed protein product [Spodoptera littoralis]CAH1638351.1 unnamed protein product [Spodoptera littoralis]
MSVQRTPPKSPTTSNILHTQSESDLNSLHFGDTTFVNVNRVKRPRHSQSPGGEDQDLKHEVLELLSGWKSELDAKLNDMCVKQNSLIAQLATEISELKTQTFKIKESNAEIATSMTFINKQYEDIKSGLDSLQKEKQEQRKCLEKLERKIQDLQLKSRTSSIEVRNVPPKDKENSDDLTNTINRIGQAVGIKISDTDLRDIYRLPGKDGSTRPIVVEFQTVQMKSNTLTAIREFNNKHKTVEDKLNTALIDIPGKRQPVFVADYLPMSSKKLFHATREFAKLNKFKFCWTSNGNIFLRKEQGDKQILISSEQCLMDLKKNL